jgi:hypothetical protein
MDRSAHRGSPPAPVTKTPGVIGSGAVRVIGLDSGKAGLSAAIR